MLTVYKYSLDTDMVEMPAGAKVLTAQSQNDKAYMWALVDTTAPLVIRRFRIFGTGFDIEHTPKDLGYIGTFQVCNGTFIWHVFEIFG